jgi:inosine-uridine nucleoside N-ribohydrolase
MIFVDSDNAMGSRSGDVDDGFALAALLGSGLQVAALASIFGNTSEPDAHRNNETIAALMNFRGELLRGARRKGEESDASSFLSRSADVDRVAALGPLTNVAKAIERGAGGRWKEIILVGMNMSSRGKYPHYWPHEFNMTLDRWAAEIVFRSGIPITLFPLDLLSPLRVTRHDLEAIEGAVGTFIRKSSSRWFWRCSILKISSSFRVCDLVAAMYLAAPELYQFEETRLRMNGRLMVARSDKGNPAKVLRSFDASEVWKRFVTTLNSLPVV